jgi:coatomer subunit beta'
MASTLLSLSKDLSKRTANNLSLQLRETVVVGKMSPNTANSVYKIQRQLFARSERVKGIDFHPVEPWILTTLYSGMWIRKPSA